MTPLGYIISVLACVALWRALLRDFQTGLALGTGLLVGLPDSLRISAGFFELTIHRVIVIFIAYFWLSTPQAKTRDSARFLGGLVWVGITMFVSLALSTRMTSSLKDCLSYAIEICLFYVILATSLTDVDGLVRIVRCVCMAVLVGAIIATMEKYTNFNLQSMLTATGMNDDETGGIAANYSSRIMLGYAMAMGVPLWIVLVILARKKKERIMAWVGLLLVIASCYFSTSRGPWLGAIVAAVLLALLGSAKPRKILLVAAALAVLVMIIRPGVKDTISSLYRGTFDEDSVKGSSYRYRWILWHVAYAEITKSPVRVLFGYGGLSTEGMVLTQYFPQEGASSIRRLGYTSWDNHYASDLIEFGFVGLGARILLYLSILAAALVVWRRGHSEYKDLTSANLAACVVYLFAMTNVYIFSPQLKFQFWIMVATATSLAWCRQRQPDESLFLDNDRGKQECLPGLDIRDGKETVERPVSQNY